MKPIIHEYARSALQDIINDDHETIRLIENKVVDTGRWETHYTAVFKDGDNFYRTNYSRGSTEMQDVSPYENEGPLIPCELVAPVEVTTIEYRTLFE